MISVLSQSPAYAELSESFAERFDFDVSAELCQPRLATSDDVVERRMARVLQLALYVLAAEVLRQRIPGDFAAGYRTIWQLATPILFVQFSILATAVVDTLMAGQRSPADLAAVGLGSSLYIVVFVAALGVLLTLQPQFAKLHGAGERRLLGQHAVQAVWTAVLLGVVAAILLWLLSPLVRWMSKSGEVAALAESYLYGFAIALPAILVFRVFYALSTVVGKAIVEEAAGIYTTLDGAGLRFDSWQDCLTHDYSVVAGASQLHAEVLQIVQDVRAAVWK